MTHFTPNKNYLHLALLALTLLHSLKPQHPKAQIVQLRTHHNCRNKQQGVSAPISRTWRFCSRSFKRWFVFYSRLQWKKAIDFNSVYLPMLIQVFSTPCIYFDLMFSQRTVKIVFFFACLRLMFSFRFLCAINLCELMS